MASLTGGSITSPSRAARTLQAFEVFRDIPRRDSLPKTGPSTYGEANGSSAEQLSSSLCPTFDDDNSKSSRPEANHDDTKNGSLDLVQGHAGNTLPFHPSKSPATSRSGVLVDNSLKLNLSPREVEHKHIHIVMSAKPSAGQKRGLSHEDHDLDQHRRKSLRLGKSIPSLETGESKDTESKDKTRQEIEAVKESSASEVPLSTSASVKEISNDSTANEKFLTDIDSEPIVQAATAHTERVSENTTIPSNEGVPTTPQSSAMYTFNSTIRRLNPFKVVGNFLGRLSASHSPSQPQHRTLSSDEIARQVDNRLQHFEDRMFDRLLALQTANQSSSVDAFGIRSQPPMTLLSSPIDVPNAVFESQDLTRGIVFPLQGFEKHESTDAMSSPLAPMSQFRKFTLDETDPQVLEKDQPNAIRSSFAAFLKSPTIGKSRRKVATETTTDPKASSTFSSLFSVSAVKANTETVPTLGLSTESQTLGSEHHNTNAPMRNGEDALMDIDGSPIRESVSTSGLTTNNNPEAPRLRNKASQHLKKMASRMNLRSKKSTINDAMPIDTDDYHIMKKKNKNAILKDYLALQREKQALEKQLAMRSEHAKEDDETTRIENAESLSPSKQVQDCDTTNLLPVLLDSKIPDLRVGRKRSSSPSPQDGEHDRVKRRSQAIPSANLSTLSPLSSLDPENAANTGQPIPEESEDVIGEKSDDGPTTFSSGKVPPVPAVPSKYRSKVPQPTKARGLTRKRKAIEEDWDGWDAEVF